MQGKSSCVLGKADHVPGLFHIGDENMIVLDSRTTAPVLKCWLQWAIKELSVPGCALVGQRLKNPALNPFSALIVHDYRS